MTPILFCGIGWMQKYAGDKNQEDKICRGGTQNVENKEDNISGKVCSSGEVCNFLRCDDDRVYGHVESIRGESDPQIRIENLGGRGNSISGVDVVWMATRPEETGYWVVGWYRDATVYRHRQYFEGKWPSQQHEHDGIENYRITAHWKNICLLEVEERKLVKRLEASGQRIIGQTRWRYPKQDDAPDIQRFIKNVRRLMDEHESTARPGRSNSSQIIQLGKNSPGTTQNDHIRYFREHETKIDPEHDRLQSEFKKHLEDRFLQGGKIDVRENLDSVDLQYTDPKRGKVLAEIKPCEKKNERYAIRTAMGQLLDYQQTYSQRTGEKPSLLIVIGTKPQKNNRDLAKSNGFGIAYQDGQTFKIIWPQH